MFGFKEWALVCDALGRGDQSIILRKGGIAEGRAGFRFQHDAFYLFPTLFHEQVAKLRVPSETALPVFDPAIIEINYFARVEWTATINDLETARRLRPFHIWKDEVVEERFRYAEKPELNLAVVRVFTWSEPWRFPNAPKFGGCRSWISLPECPPKIEMRPSINDEAHLSRTREIKKLLGHLRETT